MGYRSNIAIAIHKNIVAEDLINPIIPEALKKEQHLDYGESRYWFLSGWKWYEGYQEVAAIEAFFNYMDEIVDPIKTEGTSFTYSPYGALRIGEDRDDVQVWGDPDEYDIFLDRSINTPFPG